MMSGGMEIGAAPAAGVAGHLRALVDAARRRLAASRARAARIEALRQLALMDEAILSDIGLTRNGVRRMLYDATASR